MGGWEGARVQTFARRLGPRDGIAPPSYLPHPRTVVPFYKAAGRSKVFVLAPWSHTSSERAPPLQPAQGCARERRRFVPDRLQHSGPRACTDRRRSWLTLLFALFVMSLAHRRRGDATRMEEGAISHTALACRQGTKRAHSSITRDAGARNTVPSRQRPRPAAGRAGPRSPSPPCADARPAAAPQTRPR